MAFPEAGWPMEVNMHAKCVDEALVKAVDLVCPGGSGTGGLSEAGPLSDDRDPQSPWTLIGETEPCEVPALRMVESTPLWASCS